MKLFQKNRTTKKKVVMVCPHHIGLSAYNSLLLLRHRTLIYVQSEGAHEMLTIGTDSSHSQKCGPTIYDW